MALRATTATLKKQLALLGISGQELGQRIVARYVSACECHVSLVMQESNNVGEVVVLHRGEAGHFFVNTAVANDRPEQISVVIMAQDCGTDQIGPAGTGGVISMAKTAAGLE